MSGGRTVATDALATLGTIIGENEKRDAIHLAVLPVIAGQRLYAGQEIQVRNGVATAATGGLGIVDPFVNGPIHPDQRFWMILKPRLVTSLRHVWSHPAFPDEEAGEKGQDYEDAMEELREIAGRVDCDVTELIAGANDYLSNGTYLCDGGRWEGVYLPDEFWPLYEVVTGRKVKEDDRGSFFTCSC